MMRWRFALGVCMVSAALLVGSAGGAIAAADPDPVGTTAESQGVDGSTQGVGSATGPVAEAQPKRARPIRSVIRGAKREARRESASPRGPMTMGAMMDTEEGPHRRAPTSLSRRSPNSRTKVRIHHGGYHRGRLESGRSRVASAGGRASAGCGRIRPDCGCTGSASGSRPYGQSSRRLGVRSEGPRMQLGRFRLWSRSFPVPRHRLGMSSPRFRTCSPRLPLWAAR